MSSELPRVLVTRPFNGIAAMQVCVAPDATDEEVLTVCNRENPAGTTLGWCGVLRAPEPDRPDTAPVACAAHPERLHLLVTC